MDVDIAWHVSSTLEVVPATPDELAETGHLVEAAGARWCKARLDQRDLAVVHARSTWHQYGAAYSASKWGIIGLMKSAALEFGEYKNTVNAVVPGLIDTPLTRHRDRYAQAVDDLKSKEPTAALEAEAKKNETHMVSGDV